jgi:peroxiredoxin
MKRSIPYLIIMIMLIGGFACSSKQTKISGVIEGGAGTSLLLEKLNVNQTALVDSVEVNSKGAFSVRFHLEEPELFILKNSQGKIISLLVSPGDNISLETSEEAFETTYQVEGSPESEGIRSLVSHLESTRVEMDSLQALAAEIGSPEDPRMDPVRSSYAQAIIRQKRYTIDYIVKHMTSLSSVYALYQKYDEETLILNLDNDLQYFKSVADSLKSVYPDAALTKSLVADIDRRETNYREQYQLNTLLDMAGEETGMLDLSIPDREGEEITLSSLKGKVVLVAFWASGNSASIQALLELQSTYKKYHNSGFEVYAISMDNNKVSWMSALDFNEFKWINVSELSYPNSKAAVSYNVSSLPTNFILNRDGDIVGKNLYGKTLETWLDNLI